MVFYSSIVELKLVASTSLSMLIIIRTKLSNNKIDLYDTVREISSTCAR